MMKTTSPPEPTGSAVRTRREFVLGGAGVAAASAAMAQDSKSRSGTFPEKMIGIQIGAVSFLDEGVERVLDTIQERVRVNTLFLGTFAMGNGLFGREPTGYAFPDHGKKEYDPDVCGGNFTVVHPQYYRNTILDVPATRARDYGDFDLLASVLPSARKRNLRIVCFLMDDWYWNKNQVRNVEKLQERDVDGKSVRTLCFNNPDHLNFLLGLVEDQARSYPVDGLMYGAERQGALNSAISNRMNLLTCFCDYCVAKGKQRGINPDRARKGIRRIRDFMLSARGGKRPVDGFFVTFWRILLEYPEVLAWEMLWTDSLRQAYRSLYQRAKSIRAGLFMGWHLWHTNSFSPFFRAEQDLRQIAPYSDYLKVVMYNNAGGPRMASFVDAVQPGLFGDLSPEETLRVLYRILNYSEGSVEEILSKGLSSDYVYHEAKRSVDAVVGTGTLIWPGIDIDIPTGGTPSRTTPDGTKDAVLAAFRAGANGIILSRKYSEMRLANLSAVGEAVLELK
jgi:hypothetical protein